MGPISILRELLCLGIILILSLSASATNVSFCELNLDPSLAVEQHSGLGDLTDNEISLIQTITDNFQTPLVVFGSAAKGSRRNKQTTLPLGKGEGTRSDIDYQIPHLWVHEIERVAPNEMAVVINMLREKLAQELPSADAKATETFDFSNFSLDGHRILFTPGKRPRLYEPNFPIPKEDFILPDAFSRFINSPGVVGLAN